MKPQVFLREIGWNHDHDVSNARPLADSAGDERFLIGK